MGSGKTAVAKVLAAQLKLDMFDLDEFIAARIGRTPAQIIVEDGERAFRAIETDALTNLFETARSSVISLGGGAWIEEPNRQLINKSNCLTIWLDTSFDECWKRIQSSSEDRPLGKTEQQAYELFERRRPIYQLAAIHLEVRPGETATEIAERIHEKLTGRST